MRTAVLGHVEWIDFVRLTQLPASGDIVHAGASWQEPGGGGSVAAVQLAKLAGSCDFYTALGDDDIGHRAHHALTGLGVTVHASFRPSPQRRAITLVDARGERTIIVLGDRMGPEAADELPWDGLAETDAVYVCAGGPEVMRQARRARVVVATARILPELRAAGIALDALVRSATDPSEAYRPGDLDPPPRLIVETEGAAGGTIHHDRGSRRYEAAVIPGEIGDTYGAGDSFAAGLAYALACEPSDDDAVAFAARCGAAALTGHGPYEGQLRTAAGSAGA